MSSKGAAESRLQIGKTKETVALNHFLQKGWRLLKRNYRCLWGEIDLIFANDENSIVFVEVKYRSTLSYGTAQGSVGIQKQNRLIKTALHFIKERRLFQSDFRFDVAAIHSEGIEHIPNAFTAEGYTL